VLVVGGLGLDRQRPAAAGSSERVDRTVVAALDGTLAQQAGRDRRANDRAQQRVGRLGRCDEAVEERRWGG